MDSLSFSRVGENVRTFLAICGRMKLATRLAYGFGALIVLLMLVMAIGLNEMAGMSREITKITQVSSLKLRVLGQVESSISARAIAASNLALITDVSAHPAERKRWATANKAVVVGLQQMEQMLLQDQGNQAEAGLFASLKTQETNYRPIVESAVEYSANQQYDDAIQVLTTRGAPPLSKLLAHLSLYKGVLEQEANAGASAASVSYRRARLTMASVGVFSVAVAVALGWWTAQSITRPILEAVRTAERVAGGDLRALAAPRGGDETASLLTALARMSSELSSVVQRVRAVSKGLASSSVQIAEGSMQLANRTEEQATVIDDASRAMEKLSLTVNRNAEVADRIADVAIVAGEQVSGGSAAVAKLVRDVEDIASSSGKIADIVSIIDSIAFQTNVLSINAAIEAGRAGEAGRGFAVVATEVRSLAQRSASSAGEIKALIEASVQRIRDGRESARSVRASMQDIAGKVGAVNDLMLELKSSTTEQASGIDEVNASMSRVDKMTQQNAALVEELAASAEVLKNQAADLVQAVDVFTL